VFIVIGVVPTKEIALPVVCPTPPVHAVAGSVERVTVPLLEKFAGSFPLTLYVLVPTGKFTVSVKDTVPFGISSTGPATTAPFESTMVMFVRIPGPVEEVAIAKSICETEIASSDTETVNPPST
jgi:hypothetical protein